MIIRQVIDFAIPNVKLNFALFLISNELNETRKGMLINEMHCRHSNQQFYFARTDGSFQSLLMCCFIIRTLNAKFKLLICLIVYYEYVGWLLTVTYAYLKINM